MKTINSIKREETAREKKMKQVQVDNKTWIFVSTDVPEKEAINEFLLKQGERERKQLQQKTHTKWL